MEIGDIFVIGNPYKGRKRTKEGNYYYCPCKTPDKRFIIKRFSGTGLTIYYDYNRTNNPCKCNHCSGPKIEKTINWDRVVIVETRAQRERDLKLKLILGKL